MPSKIYLAVLVLALIVVTQCTADCFSDCETEFENCKHDDCPINPSMCLKICGGKNKICKLDCGK